MRTDFARNDSYPIVRKPFYDSTAPRGLIPVRNEEEVLSPSNRSSGGEAAPRHSAQYDIVPSEFQSPEGSADSSAVIAAIICGLRH